MNNVSVVSIPFNAGKLIQKQRSDVLYEKKLLLKILQNQQKYTCVIVSLFIKKRLCYNFKFC